ncbi:MAG: DNA polymerase III subunit gamma/tau [Chloroflexi bacterium]|nr:MAG: DNA polymerase III subunit gamma/tau [Chloroflexota bacterium]
MTQALYRKWRSQNFDELVGQEHVVQTLRNALRDDRVAHAYLFTGPRGTGKTSLARILAKALNCTAPQAERPCNQCMTCIAITEGRMLDLIEIDAASNNSVDDVRELRDKVGFRPSEGRYKVYVIDEVHMLSNSAFNALLKTLEEPPPHARFVLATTEPHKIPATIISRCQRFDFRRLAVPEIAGHLHHIVEAEGYDAEGEALTAIARAAQGCMRDAISLLDQMLSYGSDTVTFAQVQQALGAVNSQAVSALVEAVAAKDVAAGLTLIQQLLLEGASLTEFCHQVVEHLRGVLVIQMTGAADLLSDLPRETVQQMQAQAQRLTQLVTLAAIKRFSAAIGELKGGFQPQLPLELALIEAIQGEAAPLPVQGMGVTSTQTPLPDATGAPTVPPALSGAARALAKPAESQPATPEQSGEPPPLDTETLHRLRARLNEFKAIVRQRCGIKVQAALNSVRDIAVGGGSVAFAFGENHFARDMVARPETQEEVATILGQILGRPVKLECQLGEKAQLMHMVILPASDQGSSGSDPLVQYAVNQLNAQVQDA